jgi:hypothetical protein
MALFSLCCPRPSRYNLLASSPQSSTPSHPIPCPSKVCLQNPSQKFFPYFFCNEPIPGRISSSCTISRTISPSSFYIEILFDRAHSIHKPTCPFQKDVILVDEKSFSPNAMRVADEIAALNMIEVAGRYDMFVA